MEFAAFLNQFDLRQHVADPTHQLDVWLDVIVTTNDCRVLDVFPSALRQRSYRCHDPLHLQVSSSFSTVRCSITGSLDRAAFVDLEELITEYFIRLSARF